MQTHSAVKMMAIGRGPFLRSSSPRLPRQFNDRPFGARHDDWLTAGRERAMGRARGASISGCTTTLHLLVAKVLTKRGDAQPTDRKYLKDKTSSAASATFNSVDSQKRRRHRATSR
jgi:hypothetical protein